jgi:hypothetical protein
MISMPSDNRKTVDNVKNSATRAKIPLPARISRVDFVHSRRTQCKAYDIFDSFKQLLRCRNNARRGRDYRCTNQGRIAVAKEQHSAIEIEPKGA